MNNINLDYTIENIFAIPIHYLKIKNFDNNKDKLVKYAYDLKKIQPDGVNHSNRGGWQSNSFTLVNEKDEIHNTLIGIIGSIPTIKPEIDMEITSWFNINSPESYNDKHCHPNSDLAGVVWVKIPENSGDFIFNSPYEYNSFIEMHSYTDDLVKESKYYHTYKYPPREGCILIFPAHLQHRVKKNESNEDRVSISFNIKLLGVNY